MSILKLEHITKVYPASKRKESDVLAVDDFNLEVNEKEFIVFVGPSGCGKSTTLRMIAGLEDITKGKLFIHDELVNDIEPKYRNIAMVFQNYALYPHMTAYQNMAFGLKNMKVPTVKLDKNGNEVKGIDHALLGAIKSEIHRTNKMIDRLHKGEEKLKKLEEEKASGKDVDLQIEKVNNRYDFEMMSLLKERLQKYNEDYEYFSKNEIVLKAEKHLPKEEIDKRIKEAAKTLDIEELLNRKPKNMSGGQRQRVALGRAIVRTPRLFLLDEPLSNLDAKLRSQMRVEITNLYQKLNTTFIYVTHDQVEAMTMGTRIVVMRKGVVQQIDTPTNLYDFPKNRFVAGFLGTPQMNFFEGELVKKEKHIEVDFCNQHLSAGVGKVRKIKDEYLNGEAHSVILGVRSEDIEINPQGQFEVSVKLIEPLGAETLVYADFDSQKITDNDSKSMVVIKSQERVDYKAGDKIRISFKPEKIHLFKNEGAEESIME